jgi:hypothetical protein
MRYFILFLIISQNTFAGDTKIYQTDRFGNVIVGAPVLIVKDGKAYQGDRFGNVIPNSPILKPTKK